VGNPGIFWGGGGVNKFSWGQTTENGDLGVVASYPNSQGFWRQLYFGTRNFISYSKSCLIFGTLRLFMMITNLFVIANIKQLRTSVVLEFYCLFFLISWGVGFLNSAIFNSFHNRLEFGTILEGLRNFGRGGFEHPPSQYTTDTHAHNELVNVSNKFVFPCKSECCPVYLAIGQYHASNHYLRYHCYHPK